MGIMGRLRQEIEAKISEKKQEFLDERATNKEIRAAAKQAALEERRKQTIKVAVEKEKIKATNKIKTFKEKSKSNSVSGGVSAVLEGLTGVPSNAAKSKKKKEFNILQDNIF